MPRFEYTEYTTERHIRFDDSPQRAEPFEISYHNQCNNADWRSSTGHIGGETGLETSLISLGRQLERGDLELVSVCSSRKSLVVHLDTPLSSRELRRRGLCAFDGGESGNRSSRSSRAIEEPRRRDSARSEASSSTSNDRIEGWMEANGGQHPRITEVSDDDNASKVSKASRSSRRRDDDDASMVSGTSRSSRRRDDDKASKVSSSRRIEAPPSNDDNASKVSKASRPSRRRDDDKASRVSSSRRVEAPLSVGPGRSDNRALIRAAQQALSRAPSPTPSRARSRAPSVAYSHTSSAHSSSSRRSRNRSRSDSESSGSSESTVHPDDSISRFERR